MTIYLAADHAGFELKETIRQYLKEHGHQVEDCGAFEKDTDDDYPDFILPCARHVARDPGSFGVIIGASGQGEAMAANRIAGVRAAVYYGSASISQIDAEGAALGLIESVRMHNNANVLSLGARFMSEDEAVSAVALFLSTRFSGDERHLRRIGKF